jgi:hypothetical protein
MKTHLKPIHNEAYSDKSMEIGVMLNYSDEDPNWKDSLVYIYHDERYIFFETIYAMFNYMLNGAYGVKRALMSQEDFDKYDDAEYIDGTFSEKLAWVN